MDLFTAGVDSTRESNAKEVQTCTTSITAAGLKNPTRARISRRRSVTWTRSRFDNGTAGPPSWGRAPATPSVCSRKLGSPPYATRALILTNRRGFRHGREPIARFGRTLKLQSAWHGGRLWLCRHSMVRWKNCKRPSRPPDTLGNDRRGLTAFGASSVGRGAA
jgi:hypothetical protein